MTGFNNVNQLESPEVPFYLIGVVVFNDDPTKRQRVKVTVQDLLSGDVALLPWVSPLVQSDFGMTATAGVMKVPAVGSQVAVHFQDGELSYGLTLGYPVSSVHSPDAALLVNYPNRRGWRDPAGNLFWIDSTPGSVQVRFQHVSGALIHIANNGDVTVTSPQRVTVNASSEVNLNTPVTNVSGDLNVAGNITTPADVMAGAISLKTHRTSGVSPGVGISSVPVV